MRQTKIMHTHNIAAPDFVPVTVMPFPKSHGHVIVDEQVAPLDIGVYLHGTLYGNGHMPAIFNFRKHVNLVRNRLFQGWIWLVGADEHMIWESLAIAF